MKTKKSRKESMSDTRNDTAWFANPPAKRKPSTWRIISILFIVLFCLIVLGSLVRYYHLKASFRPATAQEAGVARTLVSDDLGAQGQSTSDYTVDVADKVRIVKGPDANREVLGVTLSREGERQFYLIDVEAQQIVLHSDSLAFGWMIDQPDHHKEGMQGRSIYHG